MGPEQICHEAFRQSYSRRRGFSLYLQARVPRKDLMTALPPEKAYPSDADAMSEPAEAVRPPTEPSAEEVIPLAEETLHVEKREMVTGKVRVRTVTEMVEEFVRANLHADTVEVTRVPVGKDVDAVPTVRTEGDVVIVPVLEEVLVVEKRLVLKEEVHIRRRVATDGVEIPVAVRKQHAVIERIDPDEQTGEE